MGGGQGSAQGERRVRLPLVVNPEAEADLADAKVWLCGKLLEDLRVALVDRFPYVIVYRIDDDQITVVAVYHTRRDPRGWQGRG